MTTAREVLEPRQGYGAAIRRGLAEVDTDLICIPSPTAPSSRGPDEAAALHRVLRLRGRVADGVEFHLERRHMGRFLQWAIGLSPRPSRCCLTLPTSAIRLHISRRLQHWSRPAARFPHSRFRIRAGDVMLSLVARDTVVQVPANYHPGSALRQPLETPAPPFASPADAPDRACDAHPTAAPPHRPAGRRGQDQAARQQALWNPLVHRIMARLVASTRMPTAHPHDADHRERRPVSCWLPLRWSGC